MIPKTPLLNIIGESAFRIDEKSRKAAVDFWNSDDGQKYAAAIRGMDPMNGLSTIHNVMPESMRPLVDACRDNHAMMLGLCNGFRVALMVMDQLLLPPPEKKTGKTETASQKANRILTTTES